METFMEVGKTEFRVTITCRTNDHLPSDKISLSFTLSDMELKVAIVCLEGLARRFPQEVN